MTSESDTTPQRRPPTIDLTAKEVETEQPGSPPDASAPGGAQTATVNTPRNIVRGIGPYAAAAAVGAIVAGGLLASAWFAGLAPVREAAAPATPQAVRSAAVDELSSRLDKIEKALQTPRPVDASADRAAVAATEAQTKSLAEQIGTLTRRIDELASASQAALTQAKSATAAAEGARSSAQTGVQQHDIDTLNDRVAALDNAIKAVTASVSQHAASADDRVARAAVAAEALRATVERGAPYEAELAAAQALGADPAALSALAPLAQTGIPGAAALAHELEALVPQLQRTAAAASGGNSFLGRLEAHAQNLVRITPTDASSAPAGDGPATLIARIDGDAARGDFAGARADIARLPEAARALAADWIKKAETRDAAIDASRRIAADALAALGRPVSQ